MGGDLSELGGEVRDEDVHTANYASDPRGVGGLVETS
jgi:hypothetical protein